jgi:hypothetical protein
MLIPYGYVSNKIIKRIFEDHWEELLRQHKDKIPGDAIETRVPSEFHRWDTQGNLYESCGKLLAKGGRKGYNC